MKRKIITIDEEACNGCGLCVEACHEGAIGLINGKARLLRDDYCDGLGNCLPVCPTGAITFEEREAAAFDEEAVKRKMAAAKALKAQKKTAPPTGGCPGSRFGFLNKKSDAASVEEGPALGEESPAHTPTSRPAQSHLNQWPVQIKLLPVNAPCFDGAKLLIAADCTAFSYGDFHNRFMKGKVTLIGCPKLDEGDYTEKLTAILTNNDIKSLTIVSMEVPCCGGLAQAAVNALRNSGKMIPWEIVTLSVDGRILED